MSLFKFKTVEDANKVLKRIYFLAWQACGSTSGMGFLKNNPEATEEQVWNNVVNAGDYIGGKIGTNDKEVYADYVFGRMMKLRISFDINNFTITAPDHAPERDYQGWSGKSKYISYDDLVVKACKSLDVEFEGTNKLVGT